jgi:hypothetical protein
MKAGSTDGTKNAVNLKKRENQYRTSLETYKTEKIWLWIDRKELRAKNTENMDQKQKICSLDRKIVLRSQILV